MTTLPWTPVPGQPRYRRRYVQGRHGCGWRGGRHDEPDMVAIDRVISGERSIRLGTVDRREATRILTERGCSIRFIADTLSTTHRTISRYRKELAE